MYLYEVALLVVAVVVEEVCFQIFPVGCDGFLK